ALERDQLRGLERQRRLVRGERQGKRLHRALPELAEAEMELEARGGGLGDREPALVELAGGGDGIYPAERARELASAAWGLEGAGAPRMLRPLVRARPPLLRGGGAPEGRGEPRVREAGRQSLPDVGSPGTVRGAGVLEQEQRAHVVRLQLERRLGHRGSAV